MELWIESVLVVNKRKVLRSLYLLACIIVENVSVIFLNDIEKIRRYYINWYATHGRIRTCNQLKAINEWAKSHPIEISTHQKVKYALKIGKIKKPSICEECSREAKLNAHHEDYSKPLDVKWLCHSCHKLIHTWDNLTNTIPYIFYVFNGTKMPWRE